MDRLSSNYDKDPTGNVYKLAQLTINHLQENEDTLNLMHDWGDIDQAQGKTLDMHGLDVGQYRGQAADDVYRVLIKSKIIRNLSDGSINTVLEFVSFVLQCDITEISMRELWNDFTSKNLLPPFASWSLYNKAYMISTFAGKVAASTVANPNIAKSNVVSSSLVAPSGSWTEHNQASYDAISTFNGVVKTSTTALTAGLIAQHLISFDLISIIQRKYGTTITGATIADKVAWLKANVTKLSLNWDGYGLGPNGNKASVNIWRADTLAYESDPLTHTNSVVTELKLSTIAPAYIPRYIDDNGFVHFIAFGDAATSGTASTINTDLVDITVEANVVAGITVADVAITGPYAMTLNATEQNENSSYKVAVTRNTNYILSAAHNGKMAIYNADITSTIIPFTSNQSISFNSGDNDYVTVILGNGGSGAGVYTFSNPQLELGSTVTAFKSAQTDFSLGAGAVHIDAPVGPISATGLSVKQFGALINLVVAGGVRAEVLFEGTFELGAIGEALDATKGLANAGQTTGGTLGVTYDPQNDIELPL